MDIFWIIFYAIGTIFFVFFAFVVMSYGLDEMNTDYDASYRKMVERQKEEQHNS